MSICRKCGGKLQGDVCARHGSQHKAPPSYQMKVATAAPSVHDPFSPEVDRRVFALIGVVCKGCQLSCGDLERCPVNRARWYGDQPAENAAAPEAPIDIFVTAAAKPVELQLSLF